jgi:hypothetical protein
MEFEDNGNMFVLAVFVAIAVICLGGLKVRNDCEIAKATDRIATMIEKMSTEGKIVYIRTAQAGTVRR